MALPGLRHHPDGGGAAAWGCGGRVLLQSFHPAAGNRLRAVAAVAGGAHLPEEMEPAAAADGQPVVAADSLPCGGFLGGA